jgi:hypothetical protein
MNLLSLPGFRPALVLVILGIILGAGALFYGARSTYAAVTLNVPSNLPATVTVGDTSVPTTLEFENASTGAEGDGLPASPGHADVLTVLTIDATLSCTGTGSPCTVPDVGVIVPNTVAGPNNDAVGAAGTACAGINFEISEPGTPGVYRFTPSATVLLAAPDGTAQSGLDYCRADYTSSVLKFPTVDTNGGSPGIQTRYRTTVVVNHTDAGEADSTGTDPVIVNGTPTVATNIHNAAHAVVTAVAVGSTVHDQAIVSAPAGSGGPTPTGNVNFDWFLNGDCSGAPAQNSGSLGPLDGSGQFDATGFAFTVNTVGARAFRAHYEGDTNYLPADGPCEPLQVINARIRIANNGTNAINAQHTFTCTIEVETGSPGNFVPAADGTQCSVAITNGGPGTISGSPCSTTGGSCTVTDTSAASGLDEVQACTTFTVNGVTFTNLCTTDIANPTTANCATATTPGENAVKCWVGARIRISPNGTNPVNTQHTFTCTIEVETSPGNFVPAPNGTQCTVAITNGGPGTITGSPCSTTAGSCTVTDNSPAPGLDEVQACTTFTFNQVTFTNLCTTDIANPTTANCATATTPGENAVKCWEQPPQGQGCTPGFWKTHPTDAVWGPTGYSPNQTLESVFDVPNSLGLDNVTLVDALGFGGGPGTLGAAKILLRAAVAGALNDAHPNISYGYSGNLIADVNAALASGNRSTMLALASHIDDLNNAGCGLNAHGDPI